MVLPVCVITGYLGAGKTTLIRAFLADPGGLRATVLVNDFGKINLDARLIAQTGADTIALTNGCACCTIGDDLLGAAQRAAAAGPDLLIVEASGVAQPERIVRLLRGVSGLDPARSLTVVNMSAAAQLARDKFVSTLFRQQITQASALSPNRETPGQGADLFSQRQPRYTCLKEFIDSPPAPDAGGAGVDDTPRPGFRQLVLHPEPMTAPALQDWLTNLTPAPQRAKGPLPVRGEDGSIRMAWLEFARGSFELKDLPQVPTEDRGRIVVISLA